MRKKRVPAEESTNHDRWLISYSDLITTLFAFFVVLFASSYQDKKTIQGLSQAIHVGFQDLGAFSGGASSVTAAHPDAKPAQTNPDPTSQDTASQQASPHKDGPATGPAVNVADLQKQLDAAIGQEIKNHEIDTRVTPEGFVVSLKELGFFKSGQATLMPGAAEKIQRVAKVLAKNGLDLRVEGHSDNQPIHTAQFRSNWELSTARAMAVMLLLVDDSGFDPRKISIAGYGQYRPLADNVTPEGRGTNRRVDLVVVASVPSPPHPATTK